MLCWRNSRKECTQWVVTVAPPPLVSSINLFGLWSITVLGTCTMLMMAVLKVPQISSFLLKCINWLVILSLIHRHLFNVNTLWLSLKSLSWSKRRREKKNVLDHTMMTWVFYQSLMLTTARKQVWEKKLPFWINVRSWAKSMIIKLLHEIPIYFGQLAVHLFSLRWEVNSLLSL